jgi:hypothetical protein
MKSVKILRLLYALCIASHAGVLHAQNLVFTINALADDEHQENLHETARIEDDRPLVRSRLADERAERNYINTVIVKSVEAPPLEPNGNLNEESARILLAQAYREGKLQNSAFKDINCLKVTDIKKQEQGNFTEQLFLVESSCGNAGDNRFIFKGIGEADEVEMLVKGSRHEDFQPLIYPNAQDGYPQIVFPFAYFSYKDQHGRIRSLALMNVASGQKILALMASYGSKSSIQEREGMHRMISEAYFFLGSQMARFYKRYGRGRAGLIPMGIRHGDLHIGNIFYDPNTKKITLIDNNRIAKTIGQPEYVWRDFVPLLVRREPRVKIDSAGYGEWLSLAAPSFMIGFLSVYPASDRIKLFEQIERSIATYKQNENKQMRYEKGVMSQALYTLGKNVQTCLHEGAVLKRVKKWVTKTPLVAEDVDVNTQDENGFTALHEAIAHHERLLWWPLIAAGANVNARDPKGNTPLHTAARGNNADAIKILVEAGADINARASNGQTPLDVATSNHSKDAITALRGYGAKKGTGR